MKAVTLSAHVAGGLIRLDEPFDLPTGAKLLVTVLPTDSDPERDDWYALSKAALGRAYDDDEPSYSVDSILPNDKK